MRFWSFLGGFAIFNTICDILSGSPKKNPVTPKRHTYDYEHENYLDYGAGEIDHSEIDELRDRIDYLEDDYDYDRDFYDDIHRELDNELDRELDEDFDRDYDDF